MEVDHDALGQFDLHQRLQVLYHLVVDLGEEKEMSDVEVVKDCCWNCCCSRRAMKVVQGNRTSCGVAAVCSVSTRKVVVVVIG